MNNKYYRCAVCHKFPDINEDWNFFSYNYKGIICKKCRNDKQAIIKYEKRLEKNRKYTQGDIIKTLDELLKQDIVFLGGRTRNKAWIYSQQIHWLKGRIDSGAFKYAIKKKGENDTD